MSRPWRRRLWLAAIVAGVLLALDAVIWAAGCFVVSRVSDAAIPMLASQGWAVSKGSGQWRGWPFACEIEWPDVTARSEPGMFPPGLTWHVERLRLELAFTHPRTAVLRAFGTQSVSLAGMPDVTGRAESFITWVDLAGRSPPRTEIRRLAAALPSGAATIAQATIAVLPNGWAISGSEIAVAGMAFPIKAVTAQVTVEPAFPVAVDPEASARAWRDAGGRIQLERSAIAWGPLAASATGTLALNQALQPKADGQIVSTGAADLIDALAQQGALSRGEAVAARAVLSIVSAPQPSGPLTVPLSLRDGVLSVAGFPVLRFPPLRLE